MKNLDKIFTVIAIAALCYFFWWMPRNYDNHTTETEVIKIDSSKFYEAKKVIIETQLNERTDLQPAFDSAVYNVLLDSAKLEELRASNKKAIIDRILARELHPGTGRQ